MENSVKNIKSVAFLSKNTGETYSICSTPSGCEFVKTANYESQKQSVVPEYLDNLRVMLRDVDFESLPAGTYGADLNIEFDNGKTLSLSRSAAACPQELFNDLERYFAAYWSGEVEPFCLNFSSFDGGGAEYFAEIVKGGIMTWYKTKKYQNPDHEEMCGSGFEVRFEFYPLRKGCGEAVIKANSPLYPEPDRRVFAEVDGNLKMKCRVEEVWHSNIQ